MCGIRTLQGRAKDAQVAEDRNSKLCSRVHRVLANTSVRIRTITPPSLSFAGDDAWIFEAENAATVGCPSTVPSEIWAQQAEGKKCQEDIQAPGNDGSAHITAAARDQAYA